MGGEKVPIKYNIKMVKRGGGRGLNNYRVTFAFFLLRLVGRGRLPPPVVLSRVTSRSSIDWSCCVSKAETGPMTNWLSSSWSPTRTLFRVVNSKVHFPLKASISCTFADLWSPINHTLGRLVITCFSLPNDHRRRLNSDGNSREWH